MEDDLKMAIYLVIVLCLIVISMSQYKLAYGGESYFSDSKKAGLAHMAERSDFVGTGSAEPPVFWNMGSVEETNNLLQAAAMQPETNESFTSGKTIKKMNDFASLEHFAGAGL